MNKTYLNLLESIYDKKSGVSIPSEGKTPEDGFVIQRPNLIHYAPNSAIDSIKKNGLFSEKQLCKHKPEMKEKLTKRYSSLIHSKLNIPEWKINSENILHFLDMYHPGHTKCIYAFFSRIPEGITEYQDYLKDHTPIRILLSKLKASNDDYTIYGVNFPGVKKWLKLKNQHVHKLCDKNRDWYQYFAAVDSKGFFNKVPHASVKTMNGIIPPFALKILTDN